MLKRMTVHFEGRVQGVGFRLTARQVAAGYDLCGTVENMADGRVRLIAEGEESELKAYLDGIMETHLRGLIRERQEAWGPAQGGFRGFVITD